MLPSRGRGRASGQQSGLKALLVLILLVSSGPSSGLAAQSPLEEVSSLETTISTSWRNVDRVTFKVDLGTALAKTIPTVLLGVVTTVVESLAPISILKVLSPIFSILSIVADAIGLTVFSDDQQFAELYEFLQENFIQVNAMIESNFHAIKNLEGIVLCGQVSEEVKLRQLHIGAFFTRYEEMARRAKTDRGEALKVFDTELPQYQSTKVLLEMRHLLMDKSLYVNLVQHCTKGSVLGYLQMMVELQHSFQKAIILDMAAKTRLFNLSKEALDRDRSYWRGQVSQVVLLMVETGTELVKKTWYSFYTSDVDSSLSSTARESAPNAAGILDSVLASKYPYIRTAVLLIPHEAASIEITDAFGATMRQVNENSFVCYRSRRANGDTVLVLCRNRIIYSKEQAELDTAYSTYSKGVLSLGLIDALRNNRWDDIADVMSLYQVSFFALRVGVKLVGGSVTAVQAKEAADLVFSQSRGTEFQALVTAKLVTGVSSGGGGGGGGGGSANLVRPKSVNGAGPVGGLALGHGLLWTSAAVAVTLSVTCTTAYWN